jgi:hypothetical protein
MSLPGPTRPGAAFDDAVAPLGVVVVPVFLLELSATRVPLDVAVEDDIFIEDVVAVAIAIEGFMEVDDIVIKGFMVEDDMDICAKPLLANRRAGAIIVVNNMATIATVIRRVSDWNAGWRRSLARAVEVWAAKVYR